MCKLELRDTKTNNQNRRENERPSLHVVFIKGNESVCYQSLHLNNAGEPVQQLCQLTASKKVLPRHG